ncbi:MAG: M20 family metallopeptidase [Hyphomicrobiales bacterium]
MHPSAQSSLDLIDRQDLIEIGSELVKFPSFKGDETPLARFLAEWFGARGYGVELDEVEPGRFQTIATLKGSGGGKSLMLNGHLDINSLSRGWNRDPWTAWVQGDRLHGHGIQNMKGGLASLVVAAEAIRKSGADLAGDLVLALVVGETQGGEGMHRLMQRGFRTDMAVITEPFGSGNIATVHGGIVHFAIHAIGKTGHMSRLDGTAHAIHKMMKVIEALGTVRFTYEPRSDLPDLPRLNVGSIIGGRGENYILYDAPYIPDLCTIIVDVHFVPGQSVETILGDVRRHLDPLRLADPQFSYEIEIPPPEYFKGRRRLVMPPMDVPVDSEIVRAVARSYEAVTGRPPRKIGAILPTSYSACDTSWLWEAGIPCVNYGPAATYDAAGPEETYVTISEMEECAKILVLTALDVCNL